MIKSICVFCGSARKFRDENGQEARALAQYMKQHEMALIYGGAAVGLMGAIADEAIQAGVPVTGIIPSFISDREIQHKKIQELIIVESMHQRKQLMWERSDAFLIMPGGYGTLDEMFEMLTWSQLGLHDKPIALWNIRGFYDAILAHITSLKNGNYLKKEDEDRLIVDSDLESLMKKVQAHQPRIATKIENARREG